MCCLDKMRLHNYIKIFNKIYDSDYLCINANYIIIFTKFIKIRYRNI